MRKILYDFIDLIFPNYCSGCGRPFVAGENNLCSICTIDLPVFQLDEQLLDHFSGRIEVQEARAFLKFYHGGITQKLLHSLKYNGNQELGEHLGNMFIKHLPEESIFTNIEVIVPVPLHKSKQWARGYNQSEVLAKGMAKGLGVSVDSASMVRLKKSETQTKKNRADRWHNVSGIFEIIGDNLKDKHILLVDDVITTGATLEACGETILKAGAASLSIGTLAAAM